MQKTNSRITKSAKTYNNKEFKEFIKRIEEGLKKADEGLKELRRITRRKMPYEPTKK